MNRHCLGQQPFKYFVETDPTVPQWVKKISLADIQNWNTVLNKQDILEAGQHIIIDGNVISFDHTIDELATDFQYFKIGDERIFNDLRNYFITLNEEEFIPIDIMSNTAYMQWQDGLYITQIDSKIVEFDLDNIYKVIENNNEYDVFPYYGERRGNKVFKDIINSLDEGYTIAYLDGNQYVYLVISGDDLKDSNNVTIEDGGPTGEALFNQKEFYIYNVSEQEVGEKVFILSDDDIEDETSFNKKIVEKLSSAIKVLPTDEFNPNYTYCTYNRNTDTYSPITLNENTFKQRQNGLYIRSSMWNPDTLLTSKNIDQLLYDTIGTAFGKIWTNRYNYFVENRLEDYVTSRINALNLNQYVDEDEMQIIINQIKDYVALNYVGNSEWNRVNAAIAAKQNNIYLQPMTMKTFVNGEAEYILRKKNEDEYAYGLNFERLDEEENYPYKLSLALDVLSDNETNEIYKSKFNIEPGYNGTDFYNLIDFHYGDTEYDKNTIYLSVPVATKIIDKPEVEAAVTVGALCRYLDGNFERKIVTLDSSIGFVDIAYYKKLWGITGDNWTPDDYKDLLKEWFNVSINWDDDNDQNIKNLYYDTHQRAINVNLVTSDEIKEAVEWIEINNHSETDYNDRQEAWYYSETEDGDKIFLSRQDPYPGNGYYWKHGDITQLNKIPSVDAVAKYFNTNAAVATDMSHYVYTSSMGNVYPHGSDVLNFKLKNYYGNYIDEEETFIDPYSLSIQGNYQGDPARFLFGLNKGFEKVPQNASYDSNLIYYKLQNGSYVEIQNVTESMFNNRSEDWYTRITINTQEFNLGEWVVTISGNQTITGNKTFSGQVTFSNNSKPTYYNGQTYDPIALMSDIEALPEPMVFKGTVGSGGTVEWSNLDSASASNKGWTYKVITDHNTAPICKVGDTIISDSTTWVVIPSGDEPSGTVTNIATTSASGSHLTLTGGPITSTGIITAGVESGYSIPSTAKQSEWDAKQGAISISQTVTPGTGSHAQTTTTTIVANGATTEIKSYTTIDSALSSSSKNPVANNVIFNAISNKVDAEDFQELEGIALTTRGVLTGTILTPVFSISDGAYYPTVANNDNTWKFAKADSPTYFKIYDVSNYTSVHLKSVSRAGHILTNSTPSEFSEKIHQDTTQVSTWYEYQEESGTPAGTNSEQAHILPKTGFTPYDKDITTNGKHYLIVYEINAAQNIEVVNGGGYSPITTSMFVNDGDGITQNDPYAKMSNLPTASKQAEWDSKVAGVQLNSVDLTKDANNKVNVIVPQVYRFV